MESLRNYPVTTGAPSEPTTHPALPEPWLEAILLNNSSQFEILPAPKGRKWMDSFFIRQPYKCLPLTMANQYGWVIRNPQPFSFEWDGSNHPSGVSIFDCPSYVRSQFGNGTISFNFDFIFRTSPGYNLWYRGLSNFFIDGLSPLEAIVEADWLPFVATVSWKITRPNYRITFETGAPICCVTPIRRGEIDKFQAGVRPINELPGFESSYCSFREARSDFGERYTRGEIDQREWQKFYLKGVLPDGKCAPPNHQTKIALSPFPTLMEPKE